MRKVLILIGVLGSGCVARGDLDPDSPTLHDIVSCSSDWPSQAGVNACERACEEPHPTDRSPDDTASGTCSSSFTGTSGAHESRTCYSSMIFDYRGVEGCCVYDQEHFDNGTVPVRFAVCD